MKLARSLAAAIVVISLAVPVASATTGPGDNGTIAFINSDVISTYDPATGLVDPLVENFQFIADLNWSSDGSKLTFAGQEAGANDNSLYVIDADGTDLTAVPTAGVTLVQGPDLSPDGTSLAFKGVANGRFDLFRVDLATLAVTRITNDTNIEGPAAWSPDGDLLVFERSLNGFGPPGGPPNNFDIYTAAPDGTGLTRLTTVAAAEYGPTWSPDGAQIAFVRPDGSFREDVWIMDRDGSDPVNLTATSSVDEQLPAFSPDGLSVVYTRLDVDSTSLAIRASDGSGAEEVLGVRGFDPSWGVTQGQPALRIRGVPDRAPEGNGWYLPPVTISWLVNGEPGLLPDVQVTEEGENQVVLSDEYCLEDGTCARGRITIDAEATAPTVEGVPDRDPDVNGWYTAPVSITWVRDDPAPSSGLVNFPEPTLVEDDGANQVIESEPVCDSVGLCTSASVTVSLDTVAPSVDSLSVAPAVVAPGGAISVLANVSDATSGVARAEAYFGADPGVGNGIPLALAGGVASGSVPGPASAEVLTVRAVDAAGHTATRSVLVRVVTLDGQASGTGTIVPAGSTSDPGDQIPGGNGRAKAEFSLSAKYRQGELVPTGSFKFDLGSGFSLKSTSLSWLFVDGSTAEVAGLASIRGRNGAYPFVVRATDAANDRLVVRVWSPGADIDTDAPLYQASGRVSGQVKVAAG